MLKVLVWNEQGACEVHNADSIAAALDQVFDSWDDPKALALEVRSQGVTLFRKEAGVEIPEAIDYMIDVTIGSDWGCDHTEEEGIGYADHVLLTLQRAFPGYAIDVTYDANNGEDKVLAFDEQDVKDVLHTAWDTWCSESWAAFLKVTGSPARNAAVQS